MAVTIIATPMYANLSRRYLFFWRNSIKSILCWPTSRTKYQTLCKNISPHHQLPLLTLSTMMIRLATQTPIQILISFTQDSTYSNAAILSCSQYSHTSSTCSNPMRKSLKSHKSPCSGYSIKSCSSMCLVSWEWPNWTCLTLWTNSGIILVRIILSKVSVWLILLISVLITTCLILIRSSMKLSASFRSVLRWQLKYRICMWPMLNSTNYKKYAYTYTKRTC